MRIRHGMAIVLSGMLWMAVGVWLLFKGFSLLLHPAMHLSCVLLPWVQKFAGRQQAPMILVSFGLLIGFLKGRLVLSRAATKVIQAIVSQANPLPLKNLYSKKYIMVLLSMGLLGASLRWFPVPYDVRGLVDVAIGSALINGSAFYFRYFAEKRSKA